MPPKSSVNLDALSVEQLQRLLAEKQKVQDEAEEEVAVQHEVDVVDEDEDGEDEERPVSKSSKKGKEKTAVVRQVVNRAYVEIVNHSGISIPAARPSRATAQKFTEDDVEEISERKLRTKTCDRCQLLKVGCYIGTPGKQCARCIKDRQGCFDNGISAATGLARGNPSPMNQASPSKATSSSRQSSVSASPSFSSMPPPSVGSSKSTGGSILERRIQGMSIPRRPEPLEVAPAVSKSPPLSPNAMHRAFTTMVTTYQAHTESTRRNTEAVQRNSERLAENTEAVQRMTDMMHQVFVKPEEEVYEAEGSKKAKKRKQGKGSE